MTTHDIDVELPPLPEPFTRKRVWLSSPERAVEKLIGLYTADQVREQQRAAIEADRKRMATVVESAWREGWKACRDSEYVGSEAEDSAYGDSEANRIALGLDQGESCGLEADRKRGGEPVKGEPYPVALDLNEKIFDAAAKENDLVRLYIRETEEDSVGANRTLGDLYGASDALRELLIEHLNALDAPQPAEHATQACNMQPAEPVKVSDEADALTVAYLSGYHKGKEAAKPERPIATVIAHNNHKLLSFDPGALDELPEGTILYAKK